MAQRNLGFFVGYVIVAALLITIAPIRIFVVPIITLIIVGMEFTKTAVRFVDGREHEQGDFDFFSYPPVALKYLAGAILYGLIILGGMILFIVPAIIWGIKFQFFGHFIIDQGAGPIKALQRSARITKDVKWNLLLFGVLLIGMNLLGMLVLLIGMTVTCPISIVATAFVYRKLLAQTGVAQTS